MESFRSILAPCIDNYDVGEDEEAEWPNNMISRRVVIDENGLLWRAGNAPKTPVSSEEVELCKRLASEAKKVVGDIRVGMGSEGGDEFQPFWLVAPQGEAVATRIDEALIRARFGETLFPPVTMTIEPLEEAGIWWSEVWSDSEDEDEAKHEERLKPWRAMSAWFKSQSEFSETAFVRIGDMQALWKLEENKELLPPGTELTPCVFPRLALGLTKKGSLCGLFGVSVQT